MSILIDAYRGVIDYLQGTRKELLPSPIQNALDISIAKGQSCHHILGGLYLGSSRACVESTHLELRDDRSMHRPRECHSNRQGFEVVISVCTFREICGDCLDLMGKSLEEALRPIQWFHVGKAIYDEPHLWDSLVHDCTFLNSDLARRDVPESVEEYEELNQQKKQALQGVRVKDWFAPIFEEIDQAVTHNKKVLVHCRGGVSRSATLLAAYLIKHQHLSAEAAIQTLKSKRACVEPKFTEALQEYAQLLGIFSTMP